MASRWVGAVTAVAAPTSGTWGVGDWAVDPAGNVWICTSAGTPGTWVMADARVPINALHNGEFQVCARGTTGAGSTGLPSASGRSGPDRWCVYRGSYGAGVTWTQVAGTAEFQYAMRVQRNSANAVTTAIGLAQALLTSDSVQFRSQPSVLTFWARAGANYSPTSSLLGISVDTGTGTDQAVEAAWTGAANVLASSVTLTTSWQKFTVAVPACGASITQAKLLLSMTPVGTASTNDYFEVTGVQWELGTTPHEYVRFSQLREGARCAAFYQRLQLGRGQTVCDRRVLLDHRCYMVIPISAMRAVPLVGVSSQVGFTLQGHHQRGDHPVTITASIMSSVNAIELQLTTAASTAGFAAVVRAGPGDVRRGQRGDLGPETEKEPQAPWQPEGGRGRSS